MPTGLADRLTESEVRDLVAFLSALGRLPEFTIKPDRSSPAAGRLWQATPQAAHAITRTSIKTAAQEHPDFIWQTAYSSVIGTLPLSEVPHMHSRYGSSRRPGSQLRADLPGSSPAR